MWELNFVDKNESPPLETDYERVNNGFLTLTNLQDVGDSGKDKRFLSLTNSPISHQINFA